MQICINPKDTNTFASASLDKTIKVSSDKHWIAMHGLDLGIEIKQRILHIKRTQSRCKLSGLLQKWGSTIFNIRRR
jgi:hypothetical protein